jgi:predicted nuclease with TOPRIM domain
MITTKANAATPLPMSQFPPKYTPAAGDEELERLKELIAEAEELCIEYQVEMYYEAQRSQGKIELLSKELAEIKERRAKRLDIMPFGGRFRHYLP